MPSSYSRHSRDSQAKKSPKSQVIVLEPQTWDLGLLGLGTQGEGMKSTPTTSSLNEIVRGANVNRDLTPELSDSLHDPNFGG